MQASRGVQIRKVRSSANKDGYLLSQASEIS